jgi:hypothetical protein
MNKKVQSAKDGQRFKSTRVKNNDRLKMTDIR